LLNNQSINQSINQTMLATLQPKKKPHATGYVPHTASHSDEYDDTLMSKEEFFAKIDRAMEDFRQGKGIPMLPGETLTEFLTRIHGCIE
jgi:hypothetical protein